jgi:serine/threonine-protein kinase RsbW
MTEHVLVFDSPPQDVTAVHEFLAAVWGDDASVSDDERMALELALVELTSNVIEHAGIGEGVTCRLVLDVGADAISARLSDTAEPGDVTLSDRAMPDEMAEGGRGLALVQMLVDHLGYERVDGTNVWTIRRARPGGGTAVDDG